MDRTVHVDLEVKRKAIYTEKVSFTGFYSLLPSVEMSWPFIKVNDINLQLPTNTVTEAESGLRERRGNDFKVDIDRTIRSYLERFVLDHCVARVDGGRAVL